MYEIYCKIRDAKGLKDAEVSRLAKIGKSTFSDWKSGRSAPKDKKMGKIAAALGVTEDYLVGKTDISVCPTCGFGDDPLSESSRAEHAAFHAAFLAAQEKYPFLQKQQDAAANRAKYLEQFRSPDKNDIEGKTTAYENFLMADFSLKLNENGYENAFMDFADFCRSSVTSLRPDYALSSELLSLLAEKYNAHIPDPLPEGAIPYTPEKTVPIPLVGAVSCGVPLFAEDNIEAYIDTPVRNIITGETYFWLRAKGDSMANAGIAEGDLLLIRQQSDVDSGDVAVVAIHDDVATLKRVIKKENALILQPENPAYETKIFVGDEMSAVHIRGRLMKLEKMF